MPLDVFAETRRTKPPLGEATKAHKVLSAGSDQVTMRMRRTSIRGQSALSNVDKVWNTLLKPSVHTLAKGRGIEGRRVEIKTIRAFMVP